MSLPVLGIDIAKAKFDVVLLINQRSLHKEFSNTEAGFAKLALWLDKYHATQVHACLESTGSYGLALAEWLYQAGHQVSIVNPARIHGYGQAQMARNKTDKADAALIAHFCQTQQPALWTPPPAEIRKLQAILRRVEAIKEMRQQESNRLAETVDPDIQQTLTTHITFLDEQLETLSQQLKEHFKQYPHLATKRDLLVSIPGIGEHTAAWLLAEMEDIAAYDSVRQLDAHAGLTPRHHQSGSSVKGKTRMSKLGNARLRKAIYMPALAAMRHNPFVKQLRQRLLERGKSKMTIVGAAMRKLLHLAFGVLKTGKKFDPNYAQA